MIYIYAYSIALDGKISSRTFAVSSCVGNQANQPQTPSVTPHRFAAKEKT